MGIIMLFSSFSVMERQEKKELQDFFLPIESKSLVSDGIWGDTCVLPRDTMNGLEDTKMKHWCYWDGSIVKDDEGIYHMYSSRWSQSLSHSEGWHIGTKAVHSVSNRLEGPYKDLGLVYPDFYDGLGHNVVGLRTKEGKYAVVVSESLPGNVFISDSPYGPFELLGEIKIDNNGFYPGFTRYDELDIGAVKAGALGKMSNVMIFVRPDGKYMLLARHCVPMISDDGILGPYKVLGDRAWENMPDTPQYYMEDPTIWYSDSLYHIVVNFHKKDVSYHLTSEDGISNWKNRGVAFDKKKSKFIYTDGHVERWYTVQRPTVYVENGKVKAFNFSVIDVHKGKDRGNDNHGSKIMVIPFDSEGFSKYIADLRKNDELTTYSTPIPQDWEYSRIGKKTNVSKIGFDSIVNTIYFNSQSSETDDCSDSFDYIYKEMSSNSIIQSQILSNDFYKSRNSVESGLMFRNDILPESPYVSVTISKDKKLIIRHRDRLKSKATKVILDGYDTPYWIQLQKNGGKIECYVSSSNKFNWKKVYEQNLCCGDKYYVGMISLSDKGQTGLSRFKDFEVNAIDNPLHDGIVMHTFPDTIPSRGLIDFDIQINTKRPLYVWAELENIQTGEMYKVLRNIFRYSERKKLSYDTGVDELNPENTYWFVVKAVPLHGHDSECICSGFKKIFVENK